MEDKTHAQDERKDPRDVILDLNFVPQWARKPPGENHYSEKVYSERPRQRDDKRPRRDNRRDDRRSDRRDDRSRRPRRDEQYDEPCEERPRVARPQVKELPITVSFLPEQKRLASLVRQIHHSHRAYPLMDLANLLIHDSEGYLVKIEANKESPEFMLYQCKKCKAVSASKEMLVQHIESKHLTEYYEKMEIEVDPPSGVFPGVARCRKTGILLGPPNHHSYVEKVAEVHQSKFAHMLLEDYKRNIEIVKDEAIVEQWKDECRKKTVYRLKSDPESAPLDLRKAEVEFSKKVPGLCEEVRRAIVPSGIALALEDRDVTHAIKRMWSKESRFPLTMSFAMRAAFRHMHLHMFKAGKINFVTHVKPHPVKPEDTVPNIAEVLMFLKENPGSTRQNLIEVLYPSLDSASKEAKDALKPLAWLIERGHIIEFFNGTLSVPLGRRRR